MIWKRVTAVWRPAVFVGTDSTIGAWILVFIAAVRGADYLRTGDATSPTLDLVEQTFPLLIWGLAFIIGGAVLAAGLLSRRHFIVWSGHGILFVAYLALSLGLMLPLLPFDPGIRTGSDMVYLAFAHFIFLLRTGPRPLGQDGATTGRSQGGTNAVR